MLTLQNFESQVSQTIVQRGERYFKDQAISWLEETGANIWQAELATFDWRLLIGRFT